MSEGNNKMAELVGPFLTEIAVRDALRTSVTELDARRKAGTLLGVRTADGVMVYPAWQFDTTTGNVRILAGLSLFLEVLRGQPAWTVAVLACAATASLDGLTPVEWARGGRDPHRLGQLARTVRARWTE
jgi:hypothetical protein